MEEGLEKPLVSAGACAMEILQLCAVPVPVPLRVAGNVNHICLLPYTPIQAVAQLTGKAKIGVLGP